MRIAIDIGPALDPGSGQKRYVECLLAALAAIDHDNEYFLYTAFWDGFPERVRQVRLPAAENFHQVFRRFPQRVLLPAEHFLGIRLQQRWLDPLALDVYHGTGNVLPRLNDLPTVVTIMHVGGPPDRFSLWDRFYFDNQTAFAARTADEIITISEFTRHEVMREWKKPAEKVTTVYLGGAEPSFNPSPDHDDERISELGVHEPFLLFVSMLTTRKNLPVLVRAFQQIRRSRPLQLVLVGKATAHTPALRALAAELGVSNDLLILERIDDTRLRSLYRRAAAFVYPSKLEGFGLPVIEAMACGTPVVAARATALPEVVGEAGLLVDPDSPEAFAAAILRVLDDPSYRSTLAAKGLEQARTFTWERAARETLAVYRRAAGA